jgi:hypothetical protein
LAPTQGLGREKARVNSDFVKNNLYVTMLYLYSYVLNVVKYGESEFHRRQQLRPDRLTAFRAGWSWPGQAIPYRLAVYGVVVFLSR